MARGPRARRGTRWCRPWLSRRRTYRRSRPPRSGPRPRAPDPRAAPAAGPLPGRRSRTSLSLLGWTILDLWHRVPLWGMSLMALGVTREGLFARFRRVTMQSHGRPPATTHSAIEVAAFALFEERGYEATTMDDIAEAVRVGRRTLFRYYPSKNDLHWGAFDDSLREFRRSFREMPRDRDLFDVVRDAVIAFNSFDEAALPAHRRRMRLLLGTPALLAHSELRYAAWRSVVAEYVAERLQLLPDGLLPALAGARAPAVRGA